MIILEHEMLLRQLEAMEQRALTAEQKLADCQRQLQLSNQKIEQQTFLLEQAQENSARDNERKMLAEQQTEQAVEKSLDLERRLFEADADIEGLAEYRDIMAEFQSVLQQQEQQRHHSSQPELSSVGNPERKDHESSQQKHVLLHLLQQLLLQDYRRTTTPRASATEERHSQCSDQLSITSL